MDSSVDTVFDSDSEPEEAAARGWALVKAKYHDDG